MSRLSLIVFDLDGTLVDSSHDLATAVNAMLSRLGPAAPPLPTPLVRSFIGSGARVLVARSLERAGLVHPVEEALPMFVDEYTRVLLDTTRLYPGMERALDELADRVLAVLTNKPGDMSRTLLRGLGVAHRFARIYGGGDFPAKKPDPAGLRALMEESGAGPESTAMVGDSAIDVRTGRAAGALTVGVTYGFDAEGLRADPPDLWIERPEELPARLASVETTGAPEAAPRA